MQPLSAHSGSLVRLHDRTNAWKVEAVPSWTISATRQANANKMLTVHGKGLVTAHFVLGKCGRIASRSSMTQQW